MKKIEALMIKRLMRISSWFMSVWYFDSFGLGSLLFSHSLILLHYYNILGECLEHFSIHLGLEERRQRKDKKARGSKDQARKSNIQVATMRLHAGIELHVSFS